MTKKKIDKTATKREQWIERTSLALGLSVAETIDLLKTPRQQALRINNLKARPEILEELKKLGWRGKQYPWFDLGYSIDEGLSAINNSELAANGEVFVQNAASWLPVLALDARAGESVLDVCAAPGGKTSHIASATNNEAHIWANDNSRPRLAKMQANLARLSANIEHFTLFDATMLAKKLSDQQFDKILLDAPCSGEGMMTLGKDKDFATWSVAHIKRLQHLQKRIILQAWQLLAPGGTLVYSTCTMAPEENEAVIDYLLRTAEDAQIVPIDIKTSNQVAPVKHWNGKTYNVEISKCLRLIPSAETEAFFVCKIKKLGT